MTVDTKEVVTTIAYMIGVRMSALKASYAECADLHSLRTGNRIKFHLAEIQ